MKRAAEKGYSAADRLAAGKTAYSLVYNGMENRHRKVCLCRAFIYKRLDIAFCKHTAACGNGINDFVLFCKLVKTHCIRLQKGCHLVDKTARTACTDTVHTLFKAARDINYLGILAAYFYRNIRLRYDLVNSTRNSHYLLYKGYAYPV